MSNELVADALHALTLLDPGSLERSMLELPQVNCAVVHHFGPGLYIREVAIPAGTLALGHHQLEEHLNVVLRGAVLMYDQNTGVVREVRAPLMYVGQPGRKLGYVTEDMVWQNIYATELRDITQLEERFLVKTISYEEAAHASMAVRGSVAQRDRADYFAKLALSGLDDEYVLHQSQNKTDQVSMPAGSWCVRVDKSPIHGFGVFCTAPIAERCVIGPARIGGLRTPLGRYTNHSADPNAFMHLLPNGDVILVSARALRGMAGGTPGEEITTDYWQTLRTLGVFC